MRRWWAAAKRHFARIGLVYVAFAVSLAFTLSAWSYLARTAETVDRERFDDTVSTVQQGIERRLETYIQVLHGLRALYTSSLVVDRQEFNAYLDTIGVTKQYPGMRGFAYVPRIQAEGRADAFPAVYTYPPSPNRVVTPSVDDASDVVRRAAMDAARDSAAPAATGKIALTDARGAVRAGFLIYLPLYDNAVAHDTLAQRRAALRGFIRGEFLADELLLGMFGADVNPSIDFEVFDGLQIAARHLLHDDDRLLRADNTRHYARFNRTLVIQVAGRPWTLYFSSLPGFDAASERRLPYVVLLGGLVIGLLAVGVVWLRTKNSREHGAAVEARSRLASIMEATSDFIGFADLDQRTLYINEAGRRLVGLREGQLIADKTLADFSPPWARDVILNEGIPAALRDGVWYGETALWGHDRREIPISQVIIAHKRKDGSVEYLSTIARDITERKQTELRLTYLAQYDTLTGLPNRNLFYDRLAQAMARVIRNGQMMALMFVDLDRFKDINDTLGHGAGDQVLKGVAERLKVCLREVDTIARLGGDEFTIIVEEMDDTEQATTVAQKILDTLVHPQIIEGEEVFISASIGIIVYPLHADDIDGMLKKADIAMYHAKAQGRNNYQFFSPELEGLSSERVNLGNKLRHALERGELLLYYQPQVDLRSGQIIGAEALVRWRHPELGLILPDQFIGIAEETGLIVPLGEWVLNTACMQAKAWQNEGLRPLRITVNLSTRQFKQTGLIASIDAALQNSGLDPHYLQLEITEGLLMEDIQATRAVLAELTMRGIRISIDDFGTGYSSLSYLKHFPLDVIKIDQSFVRNITTDAHNAAIAAAIISLGHNLQLKIIAEGVETEAQLHFLWNKGCDGIQGFYISPPVPVHEFMQFLERARQDAVV